MADTVRQWTRKGGWSSTNAPIPYEYDVDDESGLDDLNDTISFSGAGDKLPQGCQVDRVVLILDQFDSNATPTCTFSVILTDGTTTYELMQDRAIGRTADGDCGTAPANDQTADDVLGFRDTIDSDDWYIRVQLTAAHATEVTSGRAMKLQVYLRAVS